MCRLCFRMLILCLIWCILLSVCLCDCLCFIMGLRVCVCGSVLWNCLNLCGCCWWWLCGVLVNCLVGRSSV